jgi:hypothetical protein
MKNGLIWAGGLVLGLFLVSFSSACSNINHYRTYSDTYQNNLDTNDGVIFVVYDGQYHGAEVYQRENPNRYSVSDYAYGYTYRASKEYYSNRIYELERNHYYNSRPYRNNNIGPNWLFNGDDDYVIFQDKPNYYYSYNYYTDSYEKRSCYVNPPSDKLIYVKCP